jgi:Phage P22-like portal protein
LDEKMSQTENDKIIQEAKERWRLCSEWYGPFWRKFSADLRFRHADSENGWQWPDEIRRSRGRKPCLTLNITRQHNLQISNNTKQKRAAVKIIPTGGPATIESAEIFKGLVRCIEHKSRAQDIYGKAADFQIDGGLGWWRVVTDYCDDDTMDQEIRLYPVNDPLSVVLDPDAQEKDKRDAKYGFVFDQVPRKDFTAAYKRFADSIGDEVGLLGGALFSSFTKTDYIWICEYFRKVPKKDQLFSFVDQASGMRKNVRSSNLPDEVRDAVKSHPLTQIRDIWPEEIQWKLIVGNRIIDSTIWPGKFIPLIPVLGEETLVDGLYDCKGHTRNMKDAQRMFNYNASSQVEFVALQGKTPWIAAAEAIQGYEAMWQSANLVDHAVLIYHGMDEDFPEKQIPPPSRTEPPTAAPAYQAGMETAFNQMMMTSGQWQNQMGMMGNERTGVAIEKRVDQGDLATFHFDDNFQSALRFTGDQLLDLVPKVMNKRKVMTILAEDGTDLELELDPAAKQAYLQQVNHKGEVIKRIFNPALGSYGIAAEVGKSYASKQKETADQLTLILTQQPEAWTLIGDLLMKSFDFEEAQEAARRMKRMVPKQALGEGPSQAEQILTQQVSALQIALSKALEQTAKTGIKLVGKAQDNRVNVYKAETDRFKALADALAVEPGGLQAVIAQLVQEALATHLTPIMSENVTRAGSPAAGAEQPPVPGAKKAPDGQYYISHPGKPGKFLRVKGKSKPNGSASNAD